MTFGVITVGEGRLTKMTDLLIPCLVSAILGGVFVALLCLRAVWRLATMATEAIRERDELRAVVVPLFAEVTAYRREAAQRDEYIEQEWI